MISVVQKNELKKNLSLSPYDDDQYLIFNIYTRFKYPDKHINIHWHRRHNLHQISIRHLHDPPIFSHRGYSYFYERSLNQTRRWNFYDDHSFEDRKTVRSVIGQPFDSALPFIRGLTTPTVAPFTRVGSFPRFLPFQEIPLFFGGKPIVKRENDRPSFSPLFPIRVICVAPPLSRPSQHPPPLPFFQFYDCSFI